MAIIYKVCKCRNPRNPDAEYYKGTAVKNSDYTFENLAEDVSLATTVTKGDAMAVLASIKPFIIKALLDSRRVVLNDLGAFTIGLQGKCYPKEVLSAEDFSPSKQIKSHRQMPTEILDLNIPFGFRTVSEPQLNTSVNKQITT